MATFNVPRSAAAEIAALLDSPEIAQLIVEIEATRWTGRPPDSPVRTMVGLALVKSRYAIPVWSKTVALVREHWGLQRALGCEGKAPSIHATYRFNKKLLDHGRTIQRCTDAVVGQLRLKLPDYGRDIAIDASDMPAYANGQRLKSHNGPERKPEEYSDPDASWGHRSAVSTRKGGGFYGYKIHAVVCTSTGLPITWRVETANAQESMFSAPLIDAARRRGATATTVAMDKGYDNNRVYEECADRECSPLIPLRRTPDVKRHAHWPPGCCHGVWEFAGADRKRGATKWRCPTGECRPASTWIKADRLHPLIPRETKRWKAGYRKRAAVEREFGRLKDEWGLRPLRVRGLERVRLHTDLTVLTRLACMLNRVRPASQPRRIRD